MKTEVTDLLEAGLRAANIRQTVIANNIANVNSPGFTPGSVKFESLLADALRGDRSSDVSGIAPVLVQGGPPGSENLDTEIGELIKNSARCKIYFRMLGKLMQQMESAIGAD